MADLVALLDANVLYSALVRDLLLRLAEQGLFSPRWSDDIQAEWSRRLLEARPDLSRDRIDNTQALMASTFPNARVADFQALASMLALPDPNDRHVLAAAIRGGANFIVTYNLKDFPFRATEPFKIVAVHPDTFVILLLDSALEEVVTVMRQHRAALKHPPKSANAYLADLVERGLENTAARLRTLDIDL